ncbi:hypothetical protein [Providencia sp.]|uniref:hypothetical protein n=1 Tax=Providencia sp. TaxID=589 RepID=UPI003341060E
MMKTIPLIAVLATVLIAIASFGAGWQSANWQRDSVELVIQQAAKAAGDKATQQTLKVSSESSEKLEQQLEDIRNAPPKEIRTEIVKPIFTNVCLSPEFVSMYNDTAERIERTLSGKPIK